MSNYADSEKYASMIRSLTQFQEEINTVAASLSNAFQDCLDNMDQDDHVKEQIGFLNECLRGLKDAAQDAGDLASDIAEEFDIIVNL